MKSHRVFRAVSLVGLVLAMSAGVSAPGAAATDDPRDDVPARLAAGSPASTPVGELTALERYVRKDDGAFSWKLERSTRVEGATPGVWHALRMVSQVWRVKGEVDCPEWTHWVCIWVPDRLMSDKPILFIGGGRRKAQVPDSPPRELQMFAAAGAIIVTIDNVPNQPMRLGDDPTDRVEDGLVARTWQRAMETGDPTWLARFPMVKAAVRAMDAAEQFFAGHPQTQARLDDRPLAADFRPGPFLVAGGSKRGWTTWLTAAVDRRVGALVPLVIDVLDVPVQMRHHHDAYGFWSQALDDYVETGLTDRFQGKDRSTDPLMVAVLAHEDPIFWLSRVGDRPKLLINASGDEFFLPDSSAFYEDRLPRPWRLRYEPNSGHNLKDTSAIPDLIAFYESWAKNRAIPELTWSTRPGEANGRLVVDVRTTQRAERARLWHVDTPRDRDFRINQTGKAWIAADLTPAADDPLRYEVTLEGPSEGFRAGFVELCYPPAAEGLPPLTFTTRVFVLPDVLPHESK